MAKPEYVPLQLLPQLPQPSQAERLDHAFVRHLRMSEPPLPQFSSPTVTSSLLETATSNVNARQTTRGVERLISFPVLSRFEHLREQDNRLVDLAFAVYTSPQEKKLLSQLLSGVTGESSFEDQLYNIWGDVNPEPYNIAFTETLMAFRDELFAMAGISQLDRTISVGASRRDEAHQQINTEFAQLFEAARVLLLGPLRAYQPWEIEIMRAFQTLMAETIDTEGIDIAPDKVLDMAQDDMAFTSSEALDILDDFKAQSLADTFLKAIADAKIEMAKQKLGFVLGFDGSLPISDDLRLGWTPARKLGPLTITSPINPFRFFASDGVTPIKRDELVQLLRGKSQDGLQLIALRFILAIYKPAGSKNPRLLHVNSAIITKISKLVEFGNAFTFTEILPDGRRAVYGLKRDDEGNIVDITPPRIYEGSIYPEVRRTTA